MSGSIGKGKQKTLVLNLTSMIDICAILIIFLIMGTVIGQEDIMIPSGFKFPRSFNKEILENAPQIIVYNDEVSIKFLNKNVRVVLLQTESKEKNDLAKQIQTYIENIPTKLKSSGILLNLVADGRIPYNTIYDVSKFFRESGFQSILFVAEGN